LQVRQLLPWIEEQLLPDLRLLLLRRRHERAILFLLLLLVL
jgi:hypothetical protein